MNDYVNKITNNIGKRIKALRFNRDMTQTELANKINVSKSIISAYEKGIRLPSLEKIIQLAYVLDVPVGTFFEAVKKENIVPRTINVSGLDHKQIKVLETVIRSFRIDNQNKDED